MSQFLSTSQVTDEKYYMLTSTKESFSLVIIGSFNPVILNPDWLKDQELLSWEDAEQTKLEIVSSDLCQLTLPFGELIMTTDRFQVSTTDLLHANRLRDLAHGTLLILRHTPLTGFGLNCGAHYRAKNAEEWHAIGHYLTPKSTWDKFLEKPGMHKLEIQGLRKDDYSGSINIRLEPSSHFKSPECGVFLTVNDHVHLTEENVKKNFENFNNYFLNWGNLTEETIEFRNSIMRDILSSI